ncbi:hypothetical protein CNMCM8694_002297 [Aspergillus lentulus]|nr:hypothetical protein CNMCM8060_005494 [Aspergillus lentulus]KAF4185765.1 hypothetical protein CNMCM7927_006323 [Aspergillus lentulus]KAF4191177.1 hypothetical protein CNMCM8694_002297 [Aspergillus lentulus]
MIQPEVSRHILVSNIGHGISARAMSPNFHGTSGTVDIASAMAKITIFTAGSTLQGEEVRSKLATAFAFKDIDNLPLHQNVIRETLRLHGLIHSLLRKVKNPPPVPGPPYIIPTSHVLLAAPGVTALSDEYFPNAMAWDPHRWRHKPPMKARRISLTMDTAPCPRGPPVHISPSGLGAIVQELSWGPCATSAGLLKTARTSFVTRPWAVGLRERGRGRGQPVGA